jgi:nitroimidazol reductase NimA-like FMN-containing flavoprotein (pyridoxamine 5'-phosphate oxidase superfamily)
MRREFCKVEDPREIERILGATRIGRLATSGEDGYPYVTPVNFVYWKKNIYFHCAAEGEKLRNIARDPRVCFEVDIPLVYLGLDFDPDRPVCQLHQLFHCVIIRGRARVVSDTALKVAALNALIKKHEPAAAFEPVDENTAPVKVCRVIAITPESVSGKSDLAQNKPEKTRRAIARYLFDRNHPGDRDTAAAMGFSFD